MLWASLMSAVVVHLFKTDKEPIAMMDESDVEDEEDEFPE